MKLLAIGRLSIQYTSRWIVFVQLQFVLPSFLFVPVFVLLSLLLFELPPNFSSQRSNFCQWHFRVLLPQKFSSLWKKQKVRCQRRLWLVRVLVLCLLSESPLLFTWDLSYLRFSHFRLIKVLVLRNLWMWILIPLIWLWIALSSRLCLPLRAIIMRRRLLRVNHSKMVLFLWQIFSKKSFCLNHNFFKRSEQVCQFWKHLGGRVLLRRVVLTGHRAVHVLIPFRIMKRIWAWISVLTLRRPELLRRSGWIWQLMAIWKFRFSHSRYFKLITQLGFLLRTWVWSTYKIDQIYSLIEKNQFENDKI